MTTPVSTYRLQLHRSFTLDDAVVVAPYLRQLGVTHLYLSPILQAAAGSTHGYDTVDPSRIDEDRGGLAALDRLCDACRQLGMGIVIDIVPNHMCITSPANRWWQSVLKLGRASPWARAFDIAWDAPECGGRVVLPFLGSTLKQAIDGGELRLACEAGELRLEYHEHRWPLRPGTVARLLRELIGETAEADGIAGEFERVEAAAEPARHSPNLEALLTAAEASLADAAARHPDWNTRLTNAADHSGSADLLLSLIREQHFLPMFWREGGRRVNYRRFFDIDSLAGVRVEDPDVFEATHGLVLELAERAEVHGLRVDHPDGLRDPHAYFTQLRERAKQAWIVAEKILAPDESLPRDWPIDGTTGYDFLNDALRLFVDPAGEQVLTRTYAACTGRSDDVESVLTEGKRHAARELLAADLDRLVRAVEQAEPDAKVDRGVIADVLVELAAAMPVYRTYLSKQRGQPTQEEKKWIGEALKGVKSRRPQIDAAGVEKVARLVFRPGASADAVEAAIRFQQFSAPATAKGVEDTAFYRYARFVALNEVGGDPGRWSIGPGEFHRRVQARAAAWPDSMLAASTHDTKRSEDVRARLAVLTEMPDEWSRRVSAWCADANRLAEGIVDANTIYLLFQTLVGAWLIDEERVAAYMVKAAREAKEGTSWRAVDETYEEAIRSLVRRVLEHEALRRSIDDLVERVRTPGRIISLSQTALRLSCPGVPDTYQGCELWDLSLVDPDNRRPVDYALRATLLDELKTMALDDIWKSLQKPDDPGVSKLWLMHTMLTRRRDDAGAFEGRATYTPLPVEGEDAEHVLAYARGHSGGQGAGLSFVAVLPLRGLRRPRAGTVQLPRAIGGQWHNLCDGTAMAAGKCPLDQLFANAPLALLIAMETTT